MGNKNSKGSQSVDIFNSKIPVKEFNSIKFFNSVSDNHPVYELAHDSLIFPVRQLFINKHKLFPLEWNTLGYDYSDIQKFFVRNQKYVIASNYMPNGKDISSSIFYFGGKERIYVYIHSNDSRGKRFDNSTNTDEEDEGNEFGVVLLFSEKTDRVQSFIDYFSNIAVRKKNTGYINILIREGGYFELEQRKIDCPDIDFNLNYNNDFKSINELITEKLSIPKSKGLILLHGAAGTGKTTYIRYLINHIKKRIIYIPPNMTDIIADPDMVKTLLRYSNSILVIEDAENVLTKRGADSKQAVANILNLTDGLLSDCAHIQILATFNTDIINIDSALLRKGRLLAKYEFKPLAEDRVKKLSQKLKVKIDGEHTLADIYNANEQSFTKEKSKLGFGKN